MSTDNSFAKTAAARRWIDRYNLHTQWEEREPTTICLHECDSRYGGPEEGGWYYPRSKPSVKQSSSKQKQKNSSDPAETTSDGTHGMLHSPTSTQKRTQRNVRTTADATAHASRQSST
jgi:hypothetical protein